MKDVLLIIPAFNEEASIGDLLDKLTEDKSLDFLDILVINDASQDTTSYVVKEYPNVEIISHIFNLGYGSALQLGYKYAVRHNYKYIIQIDADGQHDICNIKSLYEALTTPGADGKIPDIVIGSRFFKSSVSFPISGIKKISIEFFRRIIKRATGQVILDPTSGLQGLDRSAFLYYSVYQNFDYEYPDANMIIQMLLMGYNVQEIPSIMHIRTAGTSMHSGIIKPMIYMITMPLSILAVYLRTRRGKQKRLVEWS
jgi:glycosyltransferase involved in cell wall biosynthesis